MSRSETAEDPGQKEKCADHGRYDPGTPLPACEVDEELAAAEIAATEATLRKAAMEQAAAGACTVFLDGACKDGKGICADTNWTHFGYALYLAVLDGLSDWHHLNN